jgi:hypothetical protein
LSGDVVDDDEEDSEVLPELSSAECERLGWRLGEANVLDGEWNAVWAREYQHACRQHALPDSSGAFVTRFETAEAPAFFKRAFQMLEQGKAEVPVLLKLESGRLMPWDTKAG